MREINLLDHVNVYDSPGSKFPLSTRDTKRTAAVEAEPTPPKHKHPQEGVGRVTHLRLAFTFKAPSTGLQHQGSNQTGGASHKMNGTFK